MIVIVIAYYAQDDHFQHDLSLLAVTPGNMVTAVAPDISVGGVVNEARFHGNTTMVSIRKLFLLMESPIFPPYYYVGFFLIFAACVSINVSLSLSISLSLSLSLCQSTSLSVNVSITFISINFSLPNSYLATSLYQIPLH